MLTYQKEQYKIFEKLEGKFKKGKIPSTIVGSMSDYANDGQLCLTSVVFLSQDLQKIIQDKIINPLKKIDSRQYYYLPESLHLTIQNIRTIHDPSLFTNKDVEKARGVFSKIVSRCQSFDFELTGLLELPTSLSVRAYSSEVLKDIVLKLREEMNMAGISDNKEYISDNIFFGNDTVCRYMKKPNKDFKNKIKELKKTGIGKLNVKTISLITTNIVCHSQKTEIIESYNLKK
jgi:hypothetical protein